MIVAAAMRHRLAVLVQDAQRLLPRGDCADAGERNPQFLRERLELARAAAIRREQQLVVVAAGEDALRLQRRVLYFFKRNIPRDPFVMYDGADARALENVGEIAGEAVGDVDGG